MISGNAEWFAANATAAAPLPSSLNNIAEQHQPIPLVGAQCTRIAAVLVLNSNADDEVTLSMARTLPFGAAVNLIPICTIPAGSDRCEGEVSVNLDAFEGAVIGVDSGSPINRRVKWHYRCIQA